VLVERKSQIEADLKLQRGRQKEAQQRFMDAQTLEGCFLERDNAVKELTALQGKKAEMEQAAKRVDLAIRALNLADLEESITRTETDRTSRSEVLKALVENIGKLSEKLQTAKHSVDTARQDNGKISGLIAEKTRLEGQLVKLKELDASRTKQLAAEKREATAKKAVDTQKKDIAGAEKRITELSTEIEQLSLAAGGVAPLEAEIKRLQEFAAAREAYDAETIKFKEVTEHFNASIKEVNTVENELTVAREHQQQLQKNFVAGQSALLAARLEDGQPCPVCGSGDHPQPAQGGANIPTEKELEKAARRISDLEKQQQKVSKEHNSLLAQKSGLESALTQRLESLGDAAKTSPAELLTQLAELKENQTAASTGMTRLGICQKEREQLAGKLTDMKGLLVQGEQEHSAAHAELESIRALVKQAMKDAGDSDEKSVAVRIEEIAGFVTRTAAALEKSEKELTSLDRQLQKACGERTQLEQQLEQLTVHYSALKKSFGIRLDTEGFSNDKAYREAKLPKKEMEKIRQDVVTFRESLASATTRRDRSEEACKEKKRPDLESVKALKDQVDTVVGDLQKEAGVLTGQHSGLTDALRTIGEKGTRITVLEQEYSVTARLADLLGGNNPHRMTLQRYVLAALFEEVAIAASQRLSRMSRGRYHLVRSETPRDGKATGGLDLDVTDGYTGEKRPAFTLSGGETFLASLSLALGLSDVVIAQQGGRYLDCIFIDEGFGSLAGETLDFALNTLIELHRTGRVIGIISHVAELKERIQSRIDVVASKDALHNYMSNFSGYSV